MKNLTPFKQFNEAIYASNWKEEYNEVSCKTFDLEIGDSFKMYTGAKIHYMDDNKSTVDAIYVGKTQELLYFTYDKDGIVYKISKVELKNKIIK